MASAESKAPRKGPRRRIGRWLRGLKGWQGLTAAVVTAGAGIIAANIAVSGPGDAGEASSAVPSSSTEEPGEEPAPEILRPTVAIREVTLLSSEPTISLRIDGESKDVPSSDDIYLIARPPGAAGQGGSEDSLKSEGPTDASPASFVSIVLRVTSDTWSVDLSVPPGTPLPLSYVAAIVPQGYFVHEGGAGCAPGLQCLPPPPLEPEEIEAKLSREGPGGLITSDPVMGPAAAP